MKLVVEQVDSEIKRSISERARTVPIEEHIPETPPAEEVSTVGDEILDFYQPDERFEAGRRHSRLRSSRTGAAKQKQVRQDFILLAGFQPASCG
jgi:hypothetical protein